jgi:hypothetical protein
MARVRQALPMHPERKEIARYLFSRGLEQLEEEGDAARLRCGCSRPPHRRGGCFAPSECEPWG